jgi:small subunit ribosomal protein S16
MDVFSKNLAIKGERIKYWLSVGAQPSDNVSVLIKKYGSEGTHLQKQADALRRLGRVTIKQPVAPTA